MILTVRIAVEITIINVKNKEKKFIQKVSFQIIMFPKSERTELNEMKEDGLDWTGMDQI